MPLSGRNLASGDELSKRAVDITAGVEAGVNASGGEGLPSGPVHFVGAGGVGMAALAAVMRGCGWSVSGCDSGRTRFGAWLEGLGVSMARGHGGAHLDAEHPAWVIRSAAVPAGTPELEEALRRGLPVLRRGEALARFLAARRSVAVAGTHGKTTTSTFAAALMRAAGLRPSWCLGGDSALFDGVGGVDDPSLVVAEADESDGTLALYAPEVTVLTNVEFDHMEHFDSVAAFEGCFRSCIEQTRRMVVYCRHDARAAALARGVRSIPYGLECGDGVGAFEVSETAGGSVFRLRIRGSDAGLCRLPVTGVHNVLNVLGAVGAAVEMGADVGRVVAALPLLSLPKRRFERVAVGRGITVISDYAHHPTEVAALVRMARSHAAGRLIGVFQPHRYTRTLALGPDFPAAFAGISELCLAPVYAASEAPLPGGTSEDLLKHFGSSGASVPLPVLCVSLEEAWAWLRARWRAGDTVLVIGAGDVEKIGAWAAGELGGTGRD